MKFHASTPFPTTFELMETAIIQNSSISEFEEFVSTKVSSCPPLLHKTSRPLENMYSRWFCHGFCADEVWPPTESLQHKFQTAEHYPLSLDPLDS
ncbi:hypothetical protein LIER_32189 [Lithospermum erythrorhizon]|uniref:Uncharacterized protein n=1 Tax=Lithospermum erythrorhizon TaxID=34254 RepID=A0AAV3RZ32_LITER